MISLFILQLICCTITTLLALQLVITSLQVRWKESRYEASRRMLFTAMSLFSIHYFLQMAHGFRAQGEDVGAVINILFYTPAAFIITIAIINVETSARNVFLHGVRSAVAYVLILGLFIIGVVANKSLHVGNLLYAMLGLFVVSMAYFIHVTRRAIIHRKEQLQQESGTDLIPYVRFSRASITMLYLTAALLPITILFNTLLIYIGPLMLLTVIFFIQTFISLGYYITPKENIMGGQEDILDDAPDMETQDSEDEVVSVAQNNLTTDRWKNIEEALSQWCKEGRFKDSEANLFSLSADLGIKRSVLPQYFNQSEYTNFRTWLSEIRYNEAVRMMKAHPTFSNDAISTECGFASHTQIYRIFKQKTGLSPSQWRAKLASS